jgi:hypothetical protein
LGYTVGELEEVLPAPEFAEWKAHYALDPWTEDRADLRMGVIAATIKNASGRYAETAHPSDFIPDYEGATEQQTDEQMMRAAMRINALMGGEVKQCQPKSPPSTPS